MKNFFQDNLYNENRVRIFAKEFYRQNKDIWNLDSEEAVFEDVKNKVKSKNLSMKLINKAYFSILKGEKILLRGHSENPIDEFNKMSSEERREMFEQIKKDIEERG